MLNIQLQDKQNRRNTFLSRTTRVKNLICLFFFVYYVDIVNTT